MSADRLRKAHTPRKKVGSQFAIVPAVFSTADFTANEAKLFIALDSLQQERTDRFACQGQDWLAIELGWGVERLRATEASLEAKRWITVHQQGQGESEYYVAHNPVRGRSNPLGIDLTAGRHERARPRLTKKRPNLKPLSERSAEASQRGLPQNEETDGRKPADLPPETRRTPTDPVNGPSAEGRSASGVGDGASTPPGTNLTERRLVEDRTCDLPSIAVADPTVEPEPVPPLQPGERSLTNRETEDRWCFAAFSYGYTDLDERCTRRPGR